MAKNLGQMLLNEIRICGPIAIDTCWPRIEIYGFTREEFTEAIKHLGDELLIDREKYYEEAILECSGKGEVIKLESVSFGRECGNASYDQVNSPPAKNAEKHEEMRTDAASQNTIVRKNSRADLVLDIVMKEPGVTIPELAERLDVDLGNLYAVVSTLDVKKGLVHRKRENGKVRIYPGKAPQEAPLASNESPSAGGIDIDVKILGKTKGSAALTPEEEQAAILDAREKGEIQILPTGGGCSCTTRERRREFAGFQSRHHFRRNRHSLGNYPRSHRTGPDSLPEARRVLQGEMTCALL